jgi:hypothetical protein
MIQDKSNQFTHEMTKKDEKNDKKEHSKKFFG